MLDSFIGDDQLKLRAESRVAWRELLVARRRNDELQTGAVAAEARLAELRALVDDTTGFEPDTEETLRAHSDRIAGLTHSLMASNQANVSGATV